jgi:hypothetical protein
VNLEGVASGERIVASESEGREITLHASRDSPPAENGTYLRLTRPQRR